MTRKKKIEWVEISRRGKAHHLLVIDSIAELHIDKLFGKAHKVKWNVSHYRELDNARWYFKEDSDKYITVLQEGEGKKKGYLLEIGREYNRRITNHRRFVDRVKNTDFRKKSNKFLAGVFAQWFEHTKQFWCFAYDYIFINKFLPDEVVMTVARRERDIMKQNEYLGVLFMADKLSEMWLEKKSLISLARFIRKRRLKLNSNQVITKIADHLKKFAHLGFYYFRGKPYNEKMIKERLREYIKLRPAEFNRLIEDLKDQQTNKRQTGFLTKRLKLDSATVHKIRTIKRWGALSNYVDETYSYAVYKLTLLWQEIAIRLGLDSVDALAHLRGREIISNLKKSTVPKALKNIANQRQKKYAYIFSGKTVRVLTGKDYARYAKQQKQKATHYTGVKELKGQAASPGVVTGKVRVVYTIHDLDKVERGEVIVTDSTNPTYVPAMERSGAIVTDEGGLLSHAAIVSRELKVPCVVGTKIGTKTLKDGDKVEVDATKGIIKKL